MPKASPKKVRRGDRLLEDLDVKRWHDSLRRSSTHTARTYLGSLGRGLEVLGHTPKSLLELDQKGRDDAVSDIISHHEAPPDGSPPLAPETVNKYMTAFVSWLRWNGLPPKRKFTVANMGWNPVAEQYQIPAQEQLRRFYHVANGRARLAGAMIHFTGMRPEVMGWEDGSTGLQLKHFPELHI